MNGNIFLDAMENIRDEYIVSAQQRLGYVSERNKRRGRSMKRIFTIALAAVLVLLTTMAVAMAVSPEFREAIISLFQIGEVEQVPEIPERANEVKQVTIGGEVSAQYVKVDGNWQVDYTGFLVRGETIQDYYQERFYDLIDGQLIEVGADAPVTTFHLSWHDVEIDSQFRTFSYKDRLYIYDIGEVNFGEAGIAIRIDPERLGTRTDMVILRGEYALSHDTSDSTGFWTIYDTNKWYWLLDLKTGKVQDPLTDCGIEKLGFLESVLFAEDGKHALVIAGDCAPRTPYLVDLENKTCTLLSELMGLDIDTESYPGYEVNFCDGVTVLLAMAPVWHPDPTSVWAYHIPSGTVMPTVIHEEALSPIYAGYSDWSLVSLVDEEGGITILNLRTGNRVKLEGIAIADSWFLEANPSKTKLLWADWKDDELHRLGVIDLESGEFTAFERAGMELRYNQAIFWLGDDRVVTMMDLHTGEEYDPNRTDEYYLCVYEF